MGDRKGLDQIGYHILGGLPRIGDGEGEDGGSKKASKSNIIYRRLLGIIAFIFSFKTANYVSSPVI